MRPNHPLAEALLGKGVGVAVPLRQGTIAETEAVVVDITSKYIYALNRSLELITGPTSSITSVQVIPVGPDGDFSELERKLKPAENSSHDFLKQFKNNKMTIGMLSRHSSRSAIQIWNDLASVSGPGILVCRAPAEEARGALIAMTNGVRQVWDPIAVLTAFMLGQQDTLVQTFGRPVVARSLVDLFNCEVEDVVRRRKHGGLSAGLVNGKLQAYVITPQELDNYIAYLNGILQWVSTNCDVVSALQSFPSSFADLQTHRVSLGPAFYDSILIARANGWILVAEEYLLRLFAKHDLGVEGIWMQMLLLHSMLNGKLSRSDYQAATVKLLSRGYWGTRLSSEDVFSMGQRSFWVPIGDFGRLFYLVSRSDVPLEFAEGVAARILSSVWSSPISKKVKRRTACRILNAIYDRGERLSIARVVQVALSSIENPIAFFEFLDFYYGYLAMRGYSQ